MEQPESQEQKNKRHGIKEEIFKTFANTREVLLVIFTTHSKDRNEWNSNSIFPNIRACSRFLVGTLDLSIESEVLCTPCCETQLNEEAESLTQVLRKCFHKNSHASKRLLEVCRIFVELGPQ